MCQRATGNPFHAFTGVPKINFAWTAGEPGRFRSSEDGERGFCRDCGTPLTFDFLPGGRMTFGIATLDDPSLADPPTRNIGTESKFPWVDDIGAMDGKTTEENSGVAYAENVKCRQFRGA